MKLSRLKKTEKLNVVPLQDNGRKSGEQTERALSSRHLQRRHAIPFPMRLHHNFHILIQRHQEAQQAFNGELAELAAQHLGYIGLADSEQLSGFYLYGRESV